ncbi:hypothetical protein BH10PSE16_BH10PSE16_27890 [soil metagenome]
MKAKVLHLVLNAMADLPGVEGCALVEIEAGMVWHTAGQMQGMQNLAEAVSDYWRLYTRLDHHFTEIGELKASIFIHAKGKLTLLPCGKGMLLVAMASQRAKVDWNQWQDKAKDLAKMVDLL